MKNREHNNQTLFSKWLLAVILLLSFFTLPGIATQSQLKLNSSCTEAPYIAQKQAVKSITYRRALKQAPSNRNTHSFFVESTISLAYFNSLQVKTLGQSYYGRNIDRLQNIRLYQHKTIPQNKGDEPAIALV